VVRDETGGAPYAAGMNRAVLAAALAVALAAPAQAAPVRVPVPPLELPGDAGAAATASWIVGVRSHSRAVRLIARRHGARPVGGGAYEVARARARAFASALGKRLMWAEPDVPRGPAQAPGADPIPTPWRDRVVRDGLQPPPAGPDTPLIGLVDSPAEPTHPEFSAGQLAVSGVAPYDLHGTATAAVAVAARNGVGMEGMWPGARALNVPLPPAPFGCTDSARGIRDAMDAGAEVINMSYGSPGFCFAEFVQLQVATARGITLVAAGGNDFETGNPLEFPASLPHVLTVSAVDAADNPSAFSNSNAAIDVAAPGQDVVAAVPPAFDEDGTADGYMSLDGTSFSAPMVSAAAAWVRHARPDLSVDQVAQVVRLGARDVGEDGWEPETGFGVLDVGGALARQAPLRDPLEPNDDVVWVNGGAFGKPDRAISKRGRRVTLRALLDRFEDPADVYRVKFPPRSRLRISVNPRFGDPDLRVLTARASDISDSPRIVAFSRRRGDRTDSVVVRNRARRGRTAFVAVYIDRGVRTLDSAYTLKVRRRR